MAPLGDGHGPKIVGHPSQRFLTTPEQRARVEALVATHAAKLDELTDPMERAEAALAIARWSAKTLADVASAHPAAAPFAALISRALAAADKLADEGGTH